MQTASIVNVLGQYPGLKWSDLVSPDYPTPEDLSLYVGCANKLIMGTRWHADDPAVHRSGRRR